MTPERWATAVLKGAHLYFIEHEGVFKGWIQLIPIRRISDQVIYLNLESGTTLFNQDIMTLEGHFVRRRTFMEEWLKSFSKQDTKGVVIGKSNIINNSGSLVHMRGSLAHRLGGWIGSHDEFEHFDEKLVDIISQNSPKKGPEGRDILSNYNPGQMILDGTASNVSRFKQFKVINGNPLENIEELRNLYEGANRDWQLRYISQFMQYDYESPEMESLIRNWWFETSKKERLKILSELKLDAQYGILRPSRLLLVLVDKKRLLYIFKVSKQASSNSIHLSLFRFGDFIRDLSDKLLRKMEKDVHNSKALVFIKQIRLGLDKIQSAESMLSVLEHSSIRVHKERDKLIKRNMDRFFLFNPTISQVIAYGKLSGRVKTSIKIHRRGLLRVRNTDEFLKVMNSFVSFPSESYREAREKLFIENMDRFFSFNPTISQVIAYGKLSTTVKVTIEIHRRGLLRVRNADEFLKVMNYFVSSPSESYREAREKLFIENMDRFFSLKPSVSQVRTFEKVSNTVKTRIRPQPYNLSDICKALFLSFSKR